MPVDMKVLAARLLGVGTLAYGVLGLAVGLIDRTWKLGVVGWSARGALLAILALVMLADAYVAMRREQTP